MKELEEYYELFFHHYLRFRTGCQQLYATETVMHICHGRRRCEITARTDIFGKPCQYITPQQLKIVYTCSKHYRLFEETQLHHTTPEIYNLNWQ